MAARAPSRRSWPGRDIPQNHQHAISIRQIMASLFALPPAVTAATARKPIFRLPCVQLSSAEGTAVKSASMKPMNTARMSARPRTNTRKKIRNASRVTRSWDRSAVLSSMKTLPRLAREVGPGHREGGDERKGERQGSPDCDGHALRTPGRRKTRRHAGKEIDSSSNLRARRARGRAKRAGSEDPAGFARRGEGRSPARI